MSELTRLVIAGAGGLGREILATAKACDAARERYNVLGFLDPDPGLAGVRVGGIPVVGDDDWCRSNLDVSLKFICAIGDPRSRRNLVAKLSAMNCAFASIVHPDVGIPDSVQLGVDTVVMAGTRFTADAVVGSHVIIYLNCSITHDVRVGDFCTIAPGCHLAGAAALGTGSQLGIGACVLPGRRVGAWSVIGAGSTVTHDIPDYAVAVGTPCRVIRTIDHCPA
jgi:sugar O-acyltransferase (sialic acid O-acetyltransferase NeuD family)